MYVLNAMKNLNLISRISRLTPTKVEQCCYIYRFSTKAKYAQKVGKNEDGEESELNNPVKYSTSPASSWQARFTREGSSAEPRLWYEPYVILGSLTIFMIYFTILREENEIDEKFTVSLYDRIEGLEEHQLRQSLQYNLDNGLSTNDIVERLKEIEEIKKRQT